ncbi:hypothetical protein L9F63_008035, partial [Diploptera punctata]
MYPLGWTISEISVNVEWSTSGYGNGTLTNNGLGGQTWEITLNLDANTFGIFEVVVITEHEVSQHERERYSKRAIFDFNELELYTSGPGIVKDKIKKIIRK